MSNLPDATKLVCPICNHEGLEKGHFARLTDPIQQEYECPACGTVGFVGFKDFSCVTVKYSGWPR